MDTITLRVNGRPHLSPLGLSADGEGDRPHGTSRGAGGNVMAATAAAIANAFFVATGRGLTRHPLTSERAKAALAGPAPT